MATLLECKNLTMAYGGHIAVENLTFAVRQGDYLGIVGENGSGKTTLMKGLLGLLPPRSGEIVRHGLLAREIGYLPQQSPVQRDFPASVWEIVLSGCLGASGLRPWYTAAQKARAMHALQQMGAEGLKDRCFRELSGGQRQRVLLARALCAADKLLLLDEPAAALDPAASAELYDAVEHLNRRHGVTVLMVLHDLLAARRTEKILYLSRSGNYFGETAAFFQSEAVRRLTGGSADV